jgi:ATP-dependent DNA helicase DinG
MTSILTQILDHIGYSSRPQQVTLFEALIETDETGTVAQAGTGTGKSIATLAAAAYWRQKTGLPSLVVVPMNVLLKQYIEVDAPRVEGALGITIRSLMGRNRYLCSAAPGFAGVARAPEEVIAREVELAPQLHGDEIISLNPADAEWFGCPGRDEGCDSEATCHYRQAKGELEGADIIITNAHLMVLDEQLRGLEEIEKKDPETGETMKWQPCIFPDYGALFVDECHTLEDVLRGFATRSIPLSAVDSLGAALAPWLQTANDQSKNPFTVQPDKKLADLLRELATWKFDPTEKPKKHHKAAVASAEFILRRGKEGAYTENEAVLWVQTDQPFPRGKKPNPKLISTQINLAGGARRILTRVPFGLVSGTVPKSLRASLGIADAVFIDCGHPFDYAKQGKLKISKWSGSFKAIKNAPELEEHRWKEMLEAILAEKGGALVLFSSYKDLEATYYKIGRELEKAGLDVRIQTRDGDKSELGRWFKDHGNAVLFGTESFATGFDVPGDALRFVGIWKLPYPGLDPVTRAIMARNRQRYEDMMRMKITQAVGRGIRTVDDRCTIFIADQRAENLIGDDDPMLSHLSEFTRADAPKRVRAWDVE